MVPRRGLWRRRKFCLLIKVLDRIHGDNCGPPSSRSSGDDRRNENDNSKRAPDPVRVQQGAPNRTLVVVSLSRTIHLWELPNIPTASALSELQFVVVTLVAERPSFASDWGGCGISSVTRGILRARIGLLPQVIKTVPFAHHRATRRRPPISDAHS
jgi:hypothetical protein